MSTYFLFSGKSHTNNEYKQEMNKLINSIDKETYNFLISCLDGYAPSVFDDEIQAYLSTGLRDNMINEKTLELEKQFIDIFNQFNFNQKNLISKN